MNKSTENHLNTKKNFAKSKCNLGKIFITILAIVFSLTSIQAMQNKNDKLRNKKVTKQKSIKK